MNYYKEVLKKYAVFEGRSRRAEYWYFALFNLIISVVLGFFGKVGSVVSTLYMIAVLVPAIAVTVRRLHDTNRSGWWILLWFIPIIGWIVLIVFLALDSEAGDNRYGSNPKGVVAVNPAPQM